MIIEKNIQVDNIEKISQEYKNLKDNKTLSGLVLKLWSNEKMIRTFPNMKIEDQDKNVIYIDSLLPEIQPYYVKIFNK